VQKFLTKKYVMIILMMLFIISFSLLLWVGIPLLKKHPTEVVTTIPSNTASLPIVLADTIQITRTTPTKTPEPLSFQSETSVPSLADNLNEILIISMVDGNYQHLFAYHPQYLPLTRLTDGNWDDIDPDVSADGKKVAFSSNRNGYWDLYYLDISTGEIFQITNSTEYDGNPSWSPDDQWLVYESYVDSNLEIYIRSLFNPTQQLIRLTTNQIVDSHPTWSPLGREIAFESMVNGNSEIWVADLNNQIEDRFFNVSNLSESNENRPSWSPDGSTLLWISDQMGINQLVTYEMESGKEDSIFQCNCQLAKWNLTQEEIYSIIESPNDNGLMGFQRRNGLQDIPYTHLVGNIDSFDILSKIPSGWISNLIASPSPYIPIALWNDEPVEKDGLSRASIVKLDGVDSPNPYLSDSVDDSFFTLKGEVGFSIGWDFLEKLTSGYLPFSEPPLPGNTQNWLLTGRAIEIDSSPMQAGWMVIALEKCFDQTYFRVFLKAYAQDGSQGKPLDMPIWDLASRINGDPYGYEQGGKLIEPPSGYWIDFTEIARRYGWSRLSALSNWRSFYPAMRYDQYVQMDYKDWMSAMLELFPVEALATYTPIPTATRIPSITPTPTRTPRYWIVPSATQ
jgi:TolB protein